MSKPTAEIQSLADARVIAAAPRLLAALKLCEKWLPRYPGRIEEIRDEARAAIAEAEGEL